MPQERQPSTDLGEFGIARLKQQSDGALILITTEPEVFARLLKARDIAPVFADTGFVLTKRAKKINAWVSEPVPVTAPKDAREKRATAIKTFLDLIMERERLATVSNLIARRQAAIAATPIRTGRVGDLLVSEATGGFHVTPDHPEQSHNTIAALLRRKGIWREAEKRWFIADGNRRILKKALDAYAARPREKKMTPDREPIRMKSMSLTSNDSGGAELEVRETANREVSVTLKNGRSSSSITVPWSVAANSFMEFFAVERSSTASVAKQTNNDH